MKRLLEFVEDDTTGKLSHTKLGSILAMLASTVIVLRVCWQATPGEGVATVLLVYCGALGVSQAASKFMSLRYGNGHSEKKPEK